MCWIRQLRRPAVAVAKLDKAIVVKLLDGSLESQFVSPLCKIISMLSAVRIDQALFGKKQPVRAAKQGFKYERLDFAIEHMVKLKSIAKFEFLVQVVLLT